jgi:hypothetical protein
MATGTWSLPPAWPAKFPDTAFPELQNLQKTVHSANSVILEKDGNRKKLFFLD